MSPVFDTMHQFVAK